MILGCVLAGGQSTRFGSDKALAELDGHTLLAAAVDALGAWCDYVVVAGRETAPAPCIPDWPQPNMGPLAGIAAALHLARDQGYDAVLTVGVDSARLPAELPQVLGAAPAFLAAQPVIGIWPASASATLDAILSAEGRHSLRQFIAAIGARAVHSPREPANINTPADLATLQSRVGEQPDGLSTAN